MGYYNDHVILQIIRILIGIAFYVAKIEPSIHTVNVEKKTNKKRKGEPEKIENVEKKDETRKRKKKEKKREYCNSDDEDDFIKEKPNEKKKKESVKKKILKNKEVEVESRQQETSDDDVFHETPDIRKKRKNLKKKKTDNSESVENLRDNNDSENEDFGILDRPVYQHMLMDSQGSLQNKKFKKL